MKRSFSVALLTLAVAGCGTIMHGGGQGIGISSAPTGATVAIDGQSMGTTPVNLELSRKERHIVRLELSGYEPYELAMTRSVSGWVWGNIIFGGIIGLAVDALTGGLYKISPELVEGSLQSIQVGGRISVLVTLEPRSDWQLIGYLEKK